MANQIDAHCRSITHACGGLLPGTLRERWDQGYVGSARYAISKAAGVDAAAAIQPYSNIGRRISKEQFSMGRDVREIEGVERVEMCVRRGVRHLDATDVLLLVFWALLAVLAAALHDRIRYWGLVVAANVAAGVLVYGLARLPAAVRWLHDWATFALVLFTYKQVYYLIGPVHQGKDYDRLLIGLDLALLGVNPTEWLVRLASPGLTELLQIAYSLFYAIFVVVGVELYLKERKVGFDRFRFTVAYGFLMSYAGYFLLPAVGPRFTLHDFASINAELPGVIATPALRAFVNFFESIPAGASSAVAFASAQRDVFPSGHTMMTIVAVALAYRNRLKLRRWMLVLGILLVFATVYLRYHYVVDLIAGGLLALVCLSTSGKLLRLLDRTREAPPRGPRLTGGV